MFNWLIKMAWRDSRRNKSRLLLFVSSIILGIAALVAIDSFSINLQQSINNEAKSLVGADLVVSSLQPLGIENEKMLDSLGGEQARELSFGSMVLFPGHEGTRFANVKAIRGNFPFYGKIATVPESSATSFRKGRKALVDKTIMLQFNVAVGDSIKIGEQMFLIEGSVTSIPGQAGIASSIAPTVIVPLEYIESSDLVQKGSRVNRNFYFKFDDNRNVEATIKPLESRLKTVKADYETVEKRKRTLGTAFSNLTDFLGLVGFIALLLGCIGVASAVHIYIKDKKPIVAVLRTLGASGKQAFLMYLIQICGMAIIGDWCGIGLRHTSCVADRIKRFSASSKHQQRYFVGRSYSGYCYGINRVAFVCIVVAH
jgi:putative ABC transport system permease protein